MGSPDNCPEHEVVHTLRLHDFQPVLSFEHLALSPRVEELGVEPNADQLGCPELSSSYFDARILNASELPPKLCEEMLNRLICRNMPAEQVDHPLEFGWLLLCDEVAEVR